MISRPYFLLSTITAANLLHPLNVYSQSLEEIIVTAQKRTENIQDVPIAITSQSGELLENLNISGTDGLDVAIPGLTITRQTNLAGAFIRGVGNNNGSAGNEPSVPIYVDGVYNPFINSNVMTFNNIERIEVLKGPQGTLFGRNATGGIIHVITRDPTQEPELRVGAGYGRYDTVESNLYGTVGLSESVATDLAVIYAKRDEGYVTNVTLDEKSGEYENILIRNKWLYTPSEKTTVRIAGSFSDEKSTYGMSKSFMEGSIGLDGVTGNSGGFYNVAEEYPSFYEHESWGLSAQVDQEFELFDLVSISGYQEFDGFFQIDQDGTPLPIVRAPITLGNDVLTQELRFLSSWDKSWQWIAGIFYMDFNAEYEPLQIGGFAAQAIGGDPVDIYAKVNTKSVAVFSEVKWALTDVTDLTVGIRKTEDKLDMGGFTLFAGNAVTPSYQDNDEFNEITYRVTLDHRVTENMMVYGSVSKGYKAGVYNIVATNGMPGPALDPEIVKSYEIGFKGDLLDNKFRLNASVFFSDYSDLQLYIDSVGTIETINAPEAEVYGGEVEALWAATDRLDIQAGLSVIKSEYTSFADGPLNPPNPAGGNFATTGDLSGNNIIRAPEFTTNLIVTYTVPTNVGAVSLNAIAEYRDEFYWDPNNATVESSRVMLNGRMSWSSADEKYRLSVWGRNLLDEEYSDYSVSSPFGNLYTPGEPATYGVSFDLSLR